MRRHRGGERNAHLVRTIRGARRLRQEHRHHGAEHIGDGRVVCRQRRHEAGRRKPRLDNQRRAIEQRLEKRVQGVGVEHRQRRHQHVVLAHAEKFAGIERPPEILRMRAAHALRQPGGPGGVENGKGIARLDRVGRHALLRPRKRRGRKVFHAWGRPFADQPQGLERHARAVQRREHGHQFALDDHEPRAAIAENVLQLRAARGGIDRHRDGAEPAAAQDRQQKLGAIAAHDGDAIARLDPGSGQCGTVAGCRLGCFGICESNAADRDQAARPVALGLACQHPRQRPIERGKQLGKRSSRGRARRRAGEH